MNQLFKESTTCKKMCFIKTSQTKNFIIGIKCWNFLTSNASCLGLCIKNTPESKKSLCWVYTEALSKRRLFLCIKSTNMTIVHHQDNQPTASSDPSKASTFWEVWLPDSCDWVFLRVRRLRCKLRSRLLFVILQKDIDRKGIKWNHIMSQLLKSLLIQVRLTWKPMQSQWWANDADFLFQYSRKVTAGSLWFLIKTEINSTAEICFPLYLRLSMLSMTTLSNSKREMVPNA